MATGVPAALASAMNGPSASKPFTYLPGGINFSEIRSPRMAKRLERHQLSNPISATTDDLDKKVQPQWSSTVPRGASVPRLPAVNDQPLRPSNQRQKSISDLLSMPMEETVQPVKLLNPPDRVVIGRDPYNPYAKQPSYITEVKQDENFAPGPYNGNNDNFMTNKPLPFPKNSTEKSNDFSKPPAPPPPPFPSSTSQNAAVLPPPVKALPFGKVPPTAPPLPPAGFLTEDLASKSKQTFKSGKVGQIHAQLEQERQLKRQAAIEEERLRIEAEEKVRREREEIQRQLELEQQRQIEIQRKIKLEEQLEKDRRQKQQEEMEMKRFLELQEQEQRQKEIQELELRRCQEKQNFDQSNRQRQHDQKGHFDLPQDINSNQAQWEPYDHEKYLKNQEHLRDDNNEMSHVKWEDEEELLKNVEQQRQLQREELDRQLRENAELELRQKLLEEEINRLKSQHWMDKNDKIVAKSLNGLTPNGQNHDLNNDIPWYDNVSQMEPMEFYEEHPRDGIDVAKAAIIFDHNMQTKEENKTSFERLPPAPQLLAHKPRRPPQLSSPHSMLRKGLPPLPHNVSRNRDKPPLSPPSTPTFSQRPLPQVPNEKSELGFQGVENSYRDLEESYQHQDSIEPYFETPSHPRYQQLPPETVNHYSRISPPKKINVQVAKPNPETPFIPFYNGFGHQKGFFEDASYNAPFFQPFIQGPFGMNNLSGFMDPLANLSRYQNQPRPPADDETKSHSQIDGARIIPIFVETRNSVVPNSNSYDSLDQKPVTILKREIKIKVAKSPPDELIVTPVSNHPAFHPPQPEHHGKQKSTMANLPKLNDVVDELRDRQKIESRTPSAKQQSLQENEEPQIDIEQKIMNYRRASEPPDARKAVMGEFARHAGGRPSGIVQRKKPSQSPSMWLLGRTYMKNNDF